MMSAGIRSMLWAVALCITAATAVAQEVPATRFLSALDLDGRAHRVGSGEEAAVVALVFLTTECPIAREYIPELNRLAAEFSSYSAKLYGVIAEPTASRAAAKRFQEEFKIEFPVLFDASSELAATLKPTHVPEAFVLNRKGEVVYRGRIDDRYREVGKKRPEASTHDLQDAVTAALAGAEIEVAETKPIGCPLSSKATTLKADDVTFNRDIAPLVYANCTECHRPGEVAPFALLTYEDASKRAEHLAQVARDGQMPPWKAELGFGHFLGERHLTEAQIALLERWSEAGAPEGNADDLPPQPQFASGWRLGKPDIVLEVPEPFTVPAGGPDIFQHFVLPIDIPENKMVVGFEFRPGNPAVVHHAILFLDSSGAARRKDAETPEPGFTTSGSIGIPVAGLVGVWTPGMTPRFFPNNTGMPIRPGMDLVLQLHIHPSGKEETDQSSLALYFADKPVERTMAGSPFVVGTLAIDIPAGSREHTVTSSVVLPADVTLVSLLPHMHLIGKEMKITAVLPDGEVKHLIWIKDWNFYWQDNYVYHDPVKLPAGTTLEVISRYDNGEDNPLNPSQPPQRVLFGNGSADEMCFGIFQLVADEEGGENKLRGALMTTFIKQWQEADLAPDARARIIEEAGKLFGRENMSFLNGGNIRPSRRGDRERDRDRTQAPVEEKPSEQS